MESEIEELILRLTEDFGKNIPQEEKRRNDLIEAFKDYLYFTVKTLRESTSKFIRKDAKSIKSVLQRIADNFDEVDIDSKKRELLKDEAFEEIRTISAEIFNTAKNKMDGKEEKQEIDIEAETKKIKSLLDKVQEYNEMQAKNLVSEALLDAQYITDNNVDILSLRLHHYEEYNEYKDEDKEL